MIKLFTLADITVAAAATRQQVTATSTRVTSIVFQGPAANTGAVYVGDSNVAAARGIEIPKGTSITVTADLLGRPGGEEFDLSDFYVDAATTGDKVKVSYVKRK
jgi:hypothetical protein